MSEQKDFYEQLSEIILIEDKNIRKEKLNNLYKQINEAIDSLGLNKDEDTFKKANECWTSLYEVLVGLGKINSQEQKELQKNESSN